METLHVLTLRVAFCVRATVVILEMDLLVQVHTLNFFVHKFSVKFPDIDECSTEGVCDENAECLDTQGSFECTCHSGYTGDGDTCLDIDECLTDPCDENATCTNNNGSFSCQCDSGFVGNGMLCTRKYYRLYDYCL